MTTWLLKTEPDTYSYDDLIRDKVEPWDGVRNPTAQMNMRAMAEGDEAFIYHTGKERRIAGLAKVVRGPYEDPAEAGARLASGELKYVLVDLSPVKAAQTPEGATLKLIKGDERFKDYELVTQSRLSVMKVPAKLDKILRKMAGI